MDNHYGWQDLVLPCCYGGGSRLSSSGVSVFCFLVMLALLCLDGACCFCRPSHSAACLLPIDYIVDLGHQHAVYDCLVQVAGRFRAGGFFGLIDRAALVDTVRDECIITCKSFP